MDAGLAPVAHRTAQQGAIARFLNRTRENRTWETTMPPAALDTPPGSPIGQAPGFHRRSVQRQAWLDQWSPGPRMCTRQRP
ncbi:MAG: hypothetical protein BRD42_09615 [Bacteroidetes bacterium QS_3_64_15]|nr:MAG: hypothetical protein BRD42_09615 [Bacteroidetes bacterium QS_3_64_15]